MPSHKKQTAVRLSERAHEIIAAAQEAFGVNITGVIEMALRRLDESEHLTKREGKE